MGKRKNEQESRLKRFWNWITTDALNQLMYSLVVVLILFVITLGVVLMIMPIGSYRTYDDKLAIYENAYILCIESSISEEYCENIALKEAGLLDE